MSITPSRAYGAVVLSGGDSRRMGRDKAHLAFGNETMLARVVRLLGEAVPLGNVVVVAGVNQQLPTLPHAVRVIRDEETGRGPLPAVTAGLRFLLTQGVAGAFVTACDFPLLQPAVAIYLLNELGAHVGTDEAACHAVVPVDAERMHPLSAACSCSCSAALSVAAAEASSTGGSNSLHAALLSGFIHLHRVPADELRQLDADLGSLKNCNTPEEYRSALAAAGLPST